MEARDFTEKLKEWTDGEVDTETRWGYGDADFFVDVEDEGTFLVSVVKVAE